MPIYESHKSLVVHFGVGDIGIGRGRVEGKPHADELVLWEGAEGEIGRPAIETNSMLSSDLPKSIRLHFARPESLAVLIDELILLRDQMMAPAGPGNSAKDSANLE